MSRLFAGTPFDIPPSCERCGKTESECECTEEQKAAAEAERQRLADRLPPEKQTARVTVQKRKGGRQATVVEGLTAKANDLPDLLAKLQSVCGTGGTVKTKDDVIELQGDHREKVAGELANLGFKVKS